MAALQSRKTQPRIMYIIWEHARFSRLVNRVSEVSAISVPSLELIFRPNGWLDSLAEKITFKALMSTDILIS